MLFVRKAYDPSSGSIAENIKKQGRTKKPPNQSNPSLAFAFFL
jgi:hypothetical protein